MSLRAGPPNGSGGARDGLLLGVDVGTYSSKGVLVTARGELLAHAGVEHALSMPAPGRFEHDAELVWWSDFVRITRTLLADAGVEPSRVACVGTSGIGPCVLPVDVAGRPLRPAILYGIDARATEEVALLERELSPEWIRRMGMTTLSAQSAGPKVLWIRRHEPELFERARWFLTSEAYLVFRLTGEATIDVYTASSYAPLFDATERAWSPRASEAVVDRAKLPSIRWPCEIAGRVSEEASRATGLAAGTPVIVGTTDAAAEAVSAGVSRPGDMMLMLGSSIFFIALAERLAPSEVFWRTHFLEPGQFALAGGMATGGSLTTWFRDQLGESERAIERAGGESSYAALARLAEGVPPGARGLLVLPYFAGERTPLNDPRAKGALFGLTLRHTRADLYRAILEGIGYGIADNLEAMTREGLEPKRLLAVGGGTRNRALLQIISDIAGRPLLIPESQLGASLGDAFLAGVGVGAVSGSEELGRWLGGLARVAPTPSTFEGYRRGLDQFRSLYQSTKAIMRALSEGEGEGER